jgi:hypothetical protein
VLDWFSSQRSVTLADLRLFFAALLGLLVVFGVCRVSDSHSSAWGTICIILSLIILVFALLSLFHRAGLYLLRYSLRYLPSPSKNTFLTNWRLRQSKMVEDILRTELTLASSELLAGDLATCSEKSILRYLGVPRMHA